MDNVHPATAALLRWFDCDHLPPHLRAIAQWFRALAHHLVYEVELDGAELTTALRKLLESKDCAVRAAIAKAEG